MTIRDKLISLYGTPKDYTLNSEKNQELKREFESKLCNWEPDPSYWPIERPRELRILPDFKSKLELALIELSQTNLINEIKTCQGCYNIRPIRGRFTNHAEFRLRFIREFYSSLPNLSTTDIEINFKEENLVGQWLNNKLSIHSWACAIDFNGDKWPRFTSKPTWSQGFLDVMKKHGLFWGGEFREKDPMHFSLVNG